MHLLNHRRVYWSQLTCFTDDQTLKTRQKGNLHMLYCCDEGSINYNSRFGVYGWAALDHCTNAQEIYVQCIEGETHDVGIATKFSTKSISHSKD